MIALGLDRDSSCQVAEFSSTSHCSMASVIEAYNRHVSAIEQILSIMLYPCKKPPVKLGRSLLGSDVAFHVELVTTAGLEAEN